MIQMPLSSGWALVMSDMGTIASQLYLHTSGPAVADRQKLVVLRQQCQAQQLA